MIPFNDPRRLFERGMTAATGHYRRVSASSRVVTAFLARARQRWLLLRLGMSEDIGRITQVATSPWLISLAGAISASVLLWVLGPLLTLRGYRPFDGEASRLSGVLGVMVAWGLFNQVRQLRDRQGNRRLVTALTLTLEDRQSDDLAVARRRATLRRALNHPEPPVAADDAGPDTAEVAGLRRSLNEALISYGRRRGERSLRRLPWYLVIGAPGAGKTSALSNAELNFPLGDILGHRPLQGVAGTRTCDWWFTSGAVLVDTAGRYTTQDSDEAVDAAAWLGLLDVLKRHRPRQPVNGVVLTVSLEDIAGQDELERQMVALALNRRLVEIDRHLGIRLPVYVLLTKADRLPGFVEFFADLTLDERRQVWGMTFPWDENGRSDATVPWSALIGRYFDDVTDRLSDRLFQRLNQETDPGRRALIVDFPQQVVSLRGVLIEFLALATRAPETSGRLKLRGVYLSSARGEGMPIDRLAPEIATTFGLEARLPPSDTRLGPPFFLTRLFPDLVFAEAHLAGRTEADAAPSQRRRRAAFALLAAAVIVTGVWGRSWLITHQALGGIADDLARATDQLPDDLGGGRLVDPVGTRPADGDATTVLPALNTLRALATERTHTTFGGGWFSGGLDAGGQLARLGDGLYQRALRRLLLPRLVVHLEEVMGRTVRAPDAPTPDRLYDALKTYLMLDGEATLDRYTVTRWFTVDWMITLPGPEREVERRQLADHLSALLEAGIQSIPGSVLVEDDARRRLAAYPVADRGYALVRALPTIRDLPGWRPAERIGPALGQVLARTSARSLTEPMPGLYTADGARQTVIPAIGRAAAELAQEGWVMGLPIDAVAVAARARHLRQVIGASYFSDYARQWQDFLNDLAVVPTGDLPHLLKVMEVAASPSSPLPALIAAMIGETSLPPPPPPLAAKKPPPPPVGPTVGTTVITAVRMITGEEDPGWWWPAASEITTRLPALQALNQPALQALNQPVLQAPNQPVLTTALAALGDLQRALERFTAAPAAKPGARAGASGREAQTEVRRAADRVRAVAAGLPAPVAGWFAAFAEASGRALLVGPGPTP